MVISRYLFITICKVVAIVEILRMLSIKVPFFLDIGSTQSYQLNTESELIKIFLPSLILWGFSYFISLPLRKDKIENDTIIIDGSKVISLILCVTFIYLIFFGFKYLNNFITSFSISPKKSIVPYLIMVKSLIWAFIMVLFIKNIHYIEKWFDIPLGDISIKFYAMINFAFLIIGLNAIIHFIYLFYQNINIIAFISDAALGKRIEIERIMQGSPKLIIGIVIISSRNFLTKLLLRSKSYS